MRSTAIRIQSCAFGALLAPYAIAACGSNAVAGLRAEPEGGSESPALSDASLSPEIPSVAGDGSLPSAAAFADVSVDVDFSQPVDLPPPATAIAGDSTGLVGSWVELGRDGSVCTPATPPSIQGTSCFHLEIQQDDGGAIEGTIHGDRAPSVLDAAFEMSIGGPFPPATDPNVGYPPNLPTFDYFSEEVLAPNVDYRLLDGVVTNGVFTFWFSPLDLWSGWCALQTPYAWNVGGETKYFCVPPTANTANTDVGKLDLCMSAFDGPQCTDKWGTVSPCPCLGGDGGIWDPLLPGCGGKVCECSATQCRANLRGSEIDATLTFEGGQLVGNIQFFPPSRGPPTPEFPFTFQRVTP